MPCSEFQSARVAPATLPLRDEIQREIDGLMRGRTPLVLFTTLARDERLFHKFFSGGLLDRGHLTIRQREIVIDRITAQRGAEYEWGVHVSVYGERAAFTKEEIASLVSGRPEDPCWNATERTIIALCDQLESTSDITDDLWSALSDSFAPEAIIELVILAGQYRMISGLVKALRLPLEPGSARFGEYRT